MSEKRRSILVAVRNAGWLVLDRTVQVTVAVSAGAMTARAVGVEAFGSWQLALTMLFMLAAASNLANADVTVPLAIRAGPAAAGTALRLRLLATGTAGLLAAGTVLAFFPDERAAGLLLLLLPLLAREPFVAVTMWFVAQGHVRPYVLVSLSALVLRFAGTVAVFLLAGTVESFALPLYAESVAYIALMILLAHRGGVLATGTPPRELVREMIGRSARGWLAAILLLASLRADRFILSFLLPPDLFGLYSAAAQINDNWFHVSLLAANAFGPALVYRARPGTQTRNATLLAVAAGAGCALVAAVISLNATAIAGIVFGGDFAAAGPILAVTVWPAALLPADTMLSLPMLHAGRLGWIARKNALILAVTVVGTCLLFPTLGVYAPAAATAAAYLSSMSWTAFSLYAMRQAARTPTHLSSGNPAGCQPLSLPNR